MCLFRKILDSKNNLRKSVSDPRGRSSQERFSAQEGLRNNRLRRSGGCTLAFRGRKTYKTASTRDATALGAPGRQKSAFRASAPQRIYKASGDFAFLGNHFWQSQEKCIRAEGSPVAGVIFCTRARWQDIVFGKASFSAFDRSLFSCRYLPERLVIALPISADFG